MRTLVIKLRYIYLPFLVIAVGFAAAYTFLDWLLFIKVDLLPIKQEVLVYWIPFFLAWAPVLIWLRPRVKLLRLSDNGWFLYQFTAAMAIGIPTFILQEYLYKTSGEMTKLVNISEMTTRKETKFYTLRDFYIDKRNASAHVEFSASGRYNDRFNMSLYIAVPIWEKHTDAVRGTCPAWLGIAYSKSIENRWASDMEKDQAFQEFRRKSEQEFNKMDLNEFAYLERTGRTEDADGFREALKKKPQIRWGKHSGAAARARRL